MKINDLPKELVKLILSSTEGFISRLVCKYWRGLIEGYYLPDFTSSLDLIKWADQSGLLNQAAMDWAAAKGRTLIIEWLLKNNKCSLDLHLTSIAALFGQVETLDWLLNNGCDYNQTVICLAAADAGQVEVLKWSRKRGGDFATSMCVRMRAEKFKQIEVLNWLNQFNPDTRK